MRRIVRTLTALLLLAACSSVDTDAPAKLPASVSVSLSRSSIVIGETTQASAVIRDANGDVLPKQPMFWQSSDPTTATVTQDGVVTGHLSGNATIVANTGTVRGTATVSIARVPTPAVGSVEIALSTPTLFSAGAARATAVVRDVRGVVVSRELRWSSSDPAIATVAGDGVVRVYTSGTVTISAQSEGVRDDLVLAVPAVHRVKATVYPSVARIGRSYGLIGVAEFANGSPAPRPVTWSLVNPADGLLTSSTYQTTLVPLVAGPIAVQLASQGVTSQITINAYGWTVTSVGGRIEASIPNHPYFAASEGIYGGRLIVGCDTGQAYLRVATNGLTVTGRVGGPERGTTGELLPNTWIPLGTSASRPANLPIDLAQTIRSMNGDAWIDVETTVGLRYYLFYTDGLRQAMAPAAQACPEFAP